MQMDKKNTEFSRRLAKKHSARLSVQERNFAGQELGRNAVAYKLTGEGTQSLFRALSREWVNMQSGATDKKRHK